MTDVNARDGEIRTRDLTHPYQDADKIKIERQEALKSNHSWSKAAAVFT
jgi:hypothetical protein